MKKILLFTFLLFATACVFAGAQKEADKTDVTYTEDGRRILKVGYAVAYGTHPTVIAIRQGVKDELAKEKWTKDFEIEYIEVDAGFESIPTNMVSNLEDLYAQKIDALLVFPPAAAEQTAEVVTSLYNPAGIPVVVTDVGIPYGEYVSFTITDNKAGGRMAADYAAKYIPEGSKVQTWNGSPGTPGITARCEGFEERMNELGMNVLPRTVTRVSVEAGQILMEDLLVSDPDIRAVMTSTTTPITGAAITLQNQDNDDVVLIPYDIDRITYENIKAGVVKAAVVQNMYALGQLGAEQMMLHLSDMPVTKDIMIPPELCTVENVEEWADNIQVKY